MMKKLYILFACILAVTVMACGSGKNPKADVDTQGANTEVQNTDTNGEKYELCYKLEQGKTYSQKMSIDMNIGVSVVGQQMDMRMVTSYAMDVAVTDVTDGIFTCNSKFTEVLISIENPMMGNISYSSKDDATNDPAVKMLKAMTEGHFSMTITKYGDVTSITGFEEMMDNTYKSMGLSASETAQAKAMMGQSFSEDKMMEQMQNMAIYPDYPVAIGDSWKMAVKTSQMEMDNTYTLKEVTADEFVIAVDSDVKAGSMEGFDGTVEGTQTGTNVVYRTSGWIKSAELKQAIAGSGKIQGMDGKMTLNSTITIEE